MAVCCFKLNLTLRNTTWPKMTSSKLGNPQVALTSPAGSEKLDNSGKLAPIELKLVKTDTKTL